MYPKAFANLIEQLQRFPGVGAKSAERYAFDILDWDESELDAFTDSLIALKTGIHICSICGNLAESEYCDICEDEERQKDVICVVQSPRDVIAMEKTQEYHGVYHVLNGVINTTKGILPDDLNIRSLLERIDDQTKEIIIATNPTVEGETTALYLARILEPYSVSITRIAHGLPMGGHLDYADELTLIKALEGRKKIQ